MAMIDERPDCAVSCRAHRPGRGVLHRVAALVLVAGAATVAAAQSSATDAFASLEGAPWPTPNAYRSASGVPGHAYWQQRVNYRIAARLDEDSREVRGRADITYTNNSPDTLSYLWLLLDQNIYRGNSLSEMSVTTDGKPVTEKDSARARRYREWQGGFHDLRVTNNQGRPLTFFIYDTLMRVDLAQPIGPGKQVRLAVEWRLPLVETRLADARDGYECVAPAEGGCIFQVAAWYPRLAAYSDYEGWHTQPFLGAGEFALEFGDYDVSLTVPDDHVVAATGELVNQADVLDPTRRARLQAARDADDPIHIITPEEARVAQRGRPGGDRTWHFRAGNVRDFAFASSRRFAWDALGVAQDDAERPLVLAMSYYPPEANPLWQEHSTRSIAHAIRVYGQSLFPYPYPVAMAVNGPVDGMEYPMIIFNAARAASARPTQREIDYLVEINIHEIGHMWFPMIINSDEREWSWMDEGLNSFVQYHAEQRWRADYPSRFGGDHRRMAGILRAPELQSLMTQPDRQTRHFSTTYSRPATALNLLRGLVLGPERFDGALAEYARRWRYKRPTPPDFFRTMEEASGVELDWFWRAWFYGSGHVDVALETLHRLQAPQDAPAFYQFTFRNVGGMVTPVVLRLDFEDGGHEKVRIPVEVWRLNPKRADWRFASERRIIAARIDPDREMADADTSNNTRTLQNKQ